MRKPSSFISCSHSRPDGGRSAGKGRQGSINAETRITRDFSGHRPLPSSRSASGLAGGPPEAVSAERPVACFGDLQPFDFERLPPFPEHTLSRRGGEAGAHPLCQLVRREAMHAHDGFGAPSRAATSEERKRAAKIGCAAKIGLWAARASKPRH